MQARDMNIMLNEVIAFSTEYYCILDSVNYIADSDNRAWMALASVNTLASYPPIREFMST